MPLDAQQSAFSAALLDPDLPAPEGIVDPKGSPAPKRFAVYRNNVTVSLIEALAAGFPVVQKIVGEEFFAAMAREFIRAHPPQSPLLMFYGREFPAFLASFEPVAHLHYLADVAQLELYRREAYHAADADPLEPGFLGEIAPEQLGAVTFGLHPSARVMSAAHPALSLWEWNQAASEADRAPLPEAGEDILIARPEMTVEMRRLPPGGFAFLTALAGGQPLGTAAEDGAQNTGFDLPTNIGGLIESRIVTAYCLKDLPQ